MPIFIELLSGTDPIMFDDLLQVVRCDPGLTAFRPGAFTDSAGGPAVAAQIAYSQKVLGTHSSNIILSVVNHARSVTLVGVDSTYILPDGSPITTYGGGAFFPSVTPTSPSFVYIDVTEAAGQGYFVLDKNGDEIDSPRQVALFHELAHAYHEFVGDAPELEQEEEVQNIADENKFRKLIGLPSRHPTIHEGGVGPGLTPTSFPKCKPLQDGSSWGCIVATAAVGSPHSPKVAALRRAKREYREFTSWASLVSRPVLESYRAFSPLVVRDMHANPALKKAVLLYAVQPAFYFLAMIETYLSEERDSPELIAKMEQCVGRYVEELMSSGGSAPALANAAGAACSVARQINSIERVSASVYGQTRAAENLFDYLVSAINAGGGEISGFAWGFEGLGLFLTQASARLGDRTNMQLPFLHDLGAWLARLPIPLDEELKLADVPCELAILGERLFTRDYTRELFARNLMERWPAAARGALQEVLRDLGYLPAN